MIDSISISQEDHKKVIETIKSMPSSAEGWVNLAHIGDRLKQNGINYQQKLKTFISEFKEIETKTSLEEQPPIVYARIKGINNQTGLSGNESSSQSLSSVKSSKPTQQNNTKLIPDENTKLSEWAFIDYSQYESLEEMILPEKWYFGNSQPKYHSGDREGNKYPLLETYVKYTFCRLAYEKKIIFTDDHKYAAFNTGLASKKGFKPVYALLERNSSKIQPWKLINFVIAGENQGKILTRYFNPLPERADYFENHPEKMVLNPTAEIDVDYEHIFIENIKRFPLDFLCKIWGKEFLVINNMSPDDVNKLDDNDIKKEGYFKELKSKLKKPLYKDKYDSLEWKFKRAKELAQNRCIWNYKTAVPQYFPTLNSMSLLLPLCFSDDFKADVALVVEMQESGRYQAQTILTLEMAYSNSRLIARPNSDWLGFDINN
ncbi:MAG: DUF3825 domain-containing protein [Acutalibacteraceae bacterium]